MTNAQPTAQQSDLFHRPIAVLHDDVVKMVAAAQVVENPVSVVRELVENSLDAGAKRVLIELEQGGWKSIRVTDSGRGIPTSELALSVTRHATSKIHTVTDLWSVSTLGFRGEGLWSIAQVSELIIQSRELGQDIGAQLSVTFGRVGDTVPLGMPIGTRVRVKSLFERVPGRKARQISAAECTRQILAWCTRIAFCRPEVEVIVKQDSKELLHLQENEDMAQRVAAVWGSVVAQSSFPLTATFEWGGVRGVCGLPQVARVHKTQQSVSVLQRPITLPELSTAIREKFKRYLPPERHPIFVLDLSVLPGLADVTQHPTKERVRLSVLAQIISDVSELISQELSARDVTHVYSPLAQSGANSTLKKQLQQTPTFSVVQELSAEEPFVQVAQTYLVASLPDGMLLIDQHAAHESILYNQYKEQVLKDITDGVATAIDPTVVQLPAAVMKTIESGEQYLSEMGWRWETLDQNHLQISSLPSAFRDLELSGVLCDIAAGLDESSLGIQPDFSELLHTALAFMACKKAIKAGDRLNQEERAKLIKAMLEMPDTYTCPHGRPAKIYMKTQYLASLFDRT